MTPLVLVAVLFAAALHGGWNAVAKAVPDRLAASSLIGATGLLIGIVGVLFTPAPAPESVVYIVISGVVQTGYLIILTAAYKHGEFGQVYPLARGLSVLVVTVFSSVILREHLSPMQTAGVGVVVVALLSLVLVGKRSARGSGLGLLLAVATGLTIATYTLVDGVGVRLSGSPIGYSMWLFVIQGALIPVVCFLMARDKQAFGRNVKRFSAMGIAGGVMSLVAYAIVVWAQSLAPLALVSALRETSVLLASIIGFLIFKEPLSRARIAVTILAVLGIVTMQLG